jgi:hypothetical protein
LARAKIRIQSGVNQLEPAALLSLLRAVSQDRERLVVRCEGKAVFLRTAEVDWVEADANYVRIHTRQRSYNIRGKISTFERSLPEHKFIRIHRSVIVNLDAVAEIQNCGNGEHVVILRNGKELPLGRTYRWIHLSEVPADGRARACARAQPVSSPTCSLSAPACGCSRQPTRSSRRCASTCRSRRRF